MKIFLLCDGGLGNQFFEYAFGRALSVRTGGELILDDWEVRGGRSRPLQLHHFNTKARFTNRFENIMCRLVDSKRLRIPARILQTIAPGLLPTVVRRKKHGFDPEVFEIKGSVFLDGWWQSELYFRDHRELILSELSFREPPNTVNQQWLDQIHATEAVCVHVRRGDYVSDPYILENVGLCGMEYYQAALDLIRQRVSSPTFFVFSDDPAWTRQNLPVPEPHHFISHNCGVSDWEDLRLMSACKHFVIANSTFSWWGAWLCTHSQKTVIAPKRWFAAARLSTKDVLPEDWITL
jgi:tellurite resistance-related uncharacterized protein